jgi:hypothetical protein
VLLSPAHRECPGAIRVGKPLQLAVDDVAGTTEAMQHPALSPRLGIGSFAQTPVPNPSRPV